MEFHYPADWTLVATGKVATGKVATGKVTTGKPMSQAAAVPEGTSDQIVVSRYTSERPIPVAGFNLGKYVRAEAKAGNILVEAYGTKGVEKSFPKGKSEVIEQPTFPGPPTRSRSLPP